MLAKKQPTHCAPRQMVSVAGESHDSQSPPPLSPTKAPCRCPTPTTRGKSEPAACHGRGPGQTHLPAWPSGWGEWESKGDSRVESTRVKP